MYYVKLYGYDKVSEPLICKLRSLVVNGFFVPQLNKSLKGTVQTITADNLRAPALDIQLHEVRSGTFTLRTKETN